MHVLRRQDDVMGQPGRRILDPADLAGRWINTNAQGRGICEIAINIDRGRVQLRPFSVAGKSLCAWETTEPNLICGSNVNSQTGTAFTSLHDFGAFQTELQGNLNLGLLVVASFNRIGAGGYDYFAREFYRRGDSAASPPSVSWTEELGRVGGDDPIEPDTEEPSLSFNGSEMFGDWLNTNPDSKGIARLRIESDGRNGATLWVWGVQVPHPVEWGMVSPALFSLSSGSRLVQAFSAKYETADVAISLQANIKQGVLVVASFTEFKDDSGRSNYFHREFYYRS